VRGMRGPSAWGEYSYGGSTSQWKCHVRRVWALIVRSRADSLIRTEGRASACNRGVALSSSKWRSRRSLLRYANGARRRRGTWSECWWQERQSKLLERCRLPTWQELQVIAGESERALCFVRRRWGQKERVRASWRRAWLLPGAELLPCLCRMRPPRVSRRTQEGQGNRLADILPHGPRDATAWKR